MITVWRMSCCKTAIGSLCNFFPKSSIGRTSSALMKVPLSSPHANRQQKFFMTMQGCVSGKKTPTATPTPVWPLSAVRNTNTIRRMHVTPFWRRRSKRFNLLLLLRYSAFVVSSAYVGLSFIESAEKETVPYTKRVRYVLFTHRLEQELGLRDTILNELMKLYGEKLLPQEHPESVRVTMITTRIIDALRRGIMQESVWSEQRNCDSERGYLLGLNWLVMVVDSPDEIEAGGAPTGKIIVCTGLLKHFTSEAEIATIMAHEVGHVIARHGAEEWNWLLATIGTLLELLLGFVTIFRFSPYVLLAGFLTFVGSRFVRGFIRKRMETEADYIGLLLTAAAGYDPRLVPAVYEKLSLFAGNPDAASPVEKYVADHPSFKERVKSLSQAHVMEEALAIYMQVESSHPVQQDLGDSITKTTT